MIASTVSPTASQATGASASRVVSIDIFRGLTMAVMIFVNAVADVRGLPWWTNHAHAWEDRMTYVDMVFPFFLFAAGMSMPLAVTQRLKRNPSTVALCLHILSRVFEPFLMVLNGIPVIVIAPLFILWLGLGILSKIGISVYIVFFTMFIPVYTASLHLERSFIDALRVMGASRWQIFWKVVVPSAMPSVYTGLKIGSGLALIGAVIGEFVASRSGLGHMILYASGTLDTPTLYLGIIILAVFAAALSFAVDAMGPLLVHWRFADEK